MSTADRGFSHFSSWLSKCDAVWTQQSQHKLLQSVLNGRVRIIFQSIYNRYVQITPMAQGPWTYHLQSFQHSTESCLDGRSQNYLSSENVRSSTFDIAGLNRCRSQKVYFVPSSLRVATKCQRHYQHLLISHIPALLNAHSEETLYTVNALYIAFWNHMQWEPCEPSSGGLRVNSYLSNIISGNFWIIAFANSIAVYLRVCSARAVVATPQL